MLVRVGGWEGAGGGVDELFYSVGVCRVFLCADVNVCWYWKASSVSIEEGDFISGILQGYKLFECWVPL